MSGADASGSSDQRRLIEDQFAILVATWDEQELLRKRILRRARDVAMRLSNVHAFRFEDELTADPPAAC